MKLLRGDGPVIRIGHRGAKTLAPENTVESFRAAVEAGVDLIEFDALALDDGSVVVAHDPTALRPGAATLDEAFEFFDSMADVGLHLDVKSPGSEAVLVDALRRHGLVGRTLATCPLAGPLRELRRLEPELTLGLGYPYDRHNLSGRRGLAPVALAAVGAMRVALPLRIAGMLERAGASVASLHYLLVTRAAVARCHDAGAAVIAWTVNDRSRIRALARAGVDGIVTDDPRLFADTLET
jgi:glycerophosphoryl diester phosphodiesterase